LHINHPQYSKNIRLVKLDLLDLIILT